MTDVARLPGCSTVVGAYTVAGTPTDQRNVGQAWGRSVTLSPGQGNFKLTTDLPVIVKGNGTPLEHRTVTVLSAK